MPLDVLREHRDELRAPPRRSTPSSSAAPAARQQAQQAWPTPGCRTYGSCRAVSLAGQSAGPVAPAGAETWDLERQVRLVAGGLWPRAVLGSAKVPALKWLAAGVGSGLVFAAVSNTCAMGTALSKMPYNRGPRTDLDAIVAALTDSRVGPGR